ncbi:hypothetical protein NP493_146g05071 [Ridgeia piscesae]|uniref:Uncharacterized protein n=1 Tax=Ridgeia piscesae TaxID=27915 RepID=A0AAD9P4M8_RIDPI|nr:hypothetical protein NP493_146g05071 [Ridgeia piscesae]
MAEVSFPNNGSRTRARDTGESFTDSFREVLKTASPKTLMYDTTDFMEEVASSPRIHTRSVSYDAVSPGIGVRVQRSKPRHRLNPDRRDLGGDEGAPRRTRSYLCGYCSTATTRQLDPC